MYTIVASYRPQDPLVPESEEQLPVTPGLHLRDVITWLDDMTAQHLPYQYLTEIGIYTDPQPVQPDDVLIL